MALHRPLGYATRYFGQCARARFTDVESLKTAATSGSELDQVGALGIALGVLTPNPIREVVFGSQPALEF